MRKMKKKYKNFRIFSKSEIKEVFFENTNEFNF